MLSDNLLAWYAEHGRDLPWRRTRDPYSIWVSEIMLQQTQVETVLPYYARFMTRYPTTEALAEAPLEEVLKVWEGLGYYARARNLHRASRIVVDHFDGDLPASEQELAALPGIGRYTADALGAIVFHRDTLALEGNLRRVLTRLFDLHMDPRRPEGERELRQRGMTILPAGRASEFNQALMDLGALVCTPRSPACDACPLAADCLAFQNGTQEELPNRQPRGPLPLRQAVAAVIQEGEKLLIFRRPESGLLGGLWGFPSGYIETGESNQPALRRVVKEQLGLEIEVELPLSPLAHTYTHFRVELQPFTCKVRSKSGYLRERENVRWVKGYDLEFVPMGKLDRMLAGELEQPDLPLRRRS
ncbi:MAG: A/G-specific adenine glycosylase [Anaerolineales bacterium]